MIGFTVSARISGVALIALIALAGGCSTFTTYRTAQPLGKGNTRIVVAPQVNGAGPRETQKIPAPEIGISVARGVTDEMDVTGTLNVLPLGKFINSFAVEGAVKRHLYRSESGRYQLAIAFGAGYRTTTSSGAVFETVHTSVPLILGIHLGRHQLVLSSSTAWQRWYSEGGAKPVDIPSIGTSIGFVWQIRERFALMPELSSAYTPVSLDAFDATMLSHFGIALVWSR